MQPKKRQKTQIECSKNGHLGFWILFDIEPQDSKSRFLKNKCLQNPQFWSYLKNRIYVISLQTHNKKSIQSFKAISLFLAICLLGFEGATTTKVILHP